MTFTMLRSLWRRSLVTLLAACLLVLASPLESNTDTRDFLYASRTGPVVEYQTGVDFWKSTAPLVVEFYSPTCGACIAYAPKFVQLAKDVTQEHPEVEFYAVSCNVHRDLCQDYDVRGYPSVNVFRANSKDKKYLRHSQLGKKMLMEELGLDKAAVGEESSRKLTGEEGVEEEEEEEEESEGEDEESNVEDEESDVEEEDLSDETSEEKSGELETQDGESGEEDQAVSTEAEQEGNPIKGTYDKMIAKTVETLDIAMPPLVVDTGADEEDSDPENVSTEDMPQPSSGGSVGKLPVGAGRAKLSQKDMDKWKQIILDRKTRLENKKKQGGRMRLRNPARDASNGKPPVPGITETMKKNLPGTSEYNARMESFFAKMSKERKKQGLKLKKGAVGLGAGASAHSPIKKGEGMPLKKDVRDRSVAGKVAMKVPVLKRLVKMTSEEMLILDATLSFTSGLRHGVFMTRDPLTPKKKAALQGWLELLSVSLPPEWGVHETIDDLLSHIDIISTSPDALDKVLNKHKYWNNNWSSSCSNNGKTKGFTCGFWKLLHVAFTGVAEHGGGLNLRDAGVVDIDTRIFSPMEAADVLREYMAHFFGCTECRDHFIGQYDQCSFRRCDRLTSDASEATPEDWKQLGLWLWEVHNDVSVRVAREKASRQMNMALPKTAAEHRFELEDEVKVLFPSIESCLTCFESDGSWNEDGVFLFLEKTYWASPDPKLDRLLKYQKQDYDVYGFRYVWLFLFVALAVAYSKRDKLSSGSSGGVQGMARSAMVVGRTAMGGKKKHSV